MKVASFLAPVLVCLVALPAWAHFIFIATRPNAAGKPAVHILFGDDSIASEAKFLDNVAHTKVWAHEAGKPPVEVKLEKEIMGENGTWMGATDVVGRAFTANCEYGVTSRGGAEPSLLVYHAKHIDATDPAALKSFARTENLKLDIVPSFQGEEGELQVLFDGKPAANAQVIIWTPDKYEKETENFTDADGKVKFKANQKGLWQVRARHTNAVAGKKGDKEYKAEKHYCTLVLKNGEVKPEAAAK
ncbi:Nickel uptake substrate-specific transmembrane region [Anatilimnocola aggregata]|uniref:Nickel uptake substrate-specific transmembrane region n=1 Tax=Anatilimnocola aggregata TaxID=2528021 RepID=A0A517Y5G6_9BACT|nr:DUF4198 domain-containing protein [Anatilimnocola aggregata]QDU25446.1 Nickel uptake substrate-specific transmembrane region [Anatilimnocola aggregata]